MFKVELQLVLKYSPITVQYYKVTQLSHALFLGTHFQQLTKPILATDLAPCRSRKQNFKSVASCSSSNYKPTSKTVAWND